MLMSEHPVYNNYLVTSNGDVISKNYKRTNRKGLLRNLLSGNGYYNVEILGKPRTIHRLVAETFLSNPLNKRCINHKDGNQLNNKISNLEWCTHGENLSHAYKVLKIKHNKPGLNKFGGLNSNSRKIKQVSKDGKFRNWDSISEAARKYNVSVSAIVNAIKRKSNCQGFNWRYI
jgi:hypothetical protein